MPSLREVAAVRGFDQNISAANDLGLGPGVSWREAFSRLPLRGDNEGTWGVTRQSPACVDIVASLHRIDGSQREGAVHFEYQSAQRYTASDHAQGVERLSVGDGNWFAFTTAGTRAFLDFVQIDHRGENGHSLREGGRIDGIESRSHFTIEPSGGGQEHGSGLDSTGRFLAVSSFAPAGVSILDVEPLARRSSPVRVAHLTIDGSLGEDGIGPNGEGASAHYCGLTRLSDGRYLLFVAQDQREKPWQDSEHRGWFYVSAGFGLSENDGWQYVGMIDWANTDLEERKAYQSASLLVGTEGQIFLALFRPGRSKKNYVDVNQLSIVEGSRQVKMKRLTTK